MHISGSVILSQSTFKLYAAFSDGVFSIAATLIVLDLT